MLLTFGLFIGWMHLLVLIVEERRKIVLAANCEECYRDNGL